MCCTALRRWLVKYFARGLCLDLGEYMYSTDKIVITGFCTDQLVWAIAPYEFHRMGHRPIRISSNGTAAPYAILHSARLLLLRQIIAKCNF